jgi:OOP family OmpA-OmpF porin
MARYLLRAFIFIIIATLVIGCAAKKRPPRFKPVDLTKELQDGKYVKKIDNLMIIVDSSSSMSDKYKKKVKYEIVKDLLKRFNQSLPEVEMKIGLTKYGFVISPFEKETALIYGLTDYDRKEFAEAIGKIEKGLGRSAMILGINAAAEDLKNPEGGIAVIIISDWEHTEEFSVEAAGNMKNLFGDRICIYTIMVGEDTEGKVMMKKVAEATYCGFPKTFDELASGSQMASFIKRIFLEKAPPKVEVVEEVQPPVQKPAPFIAEQTLFMATLEADVLFDFNSAALKPGAEEELDKIIATLNNYPETIITVEGHTDSHGSRSYNQGLSERRAAAVKDALVRKGIDPTRIEAIGFGESRLISIDDALNRRVTISTSQ